MSLREIRQILAIRDRRDAPCGHVRAVLTERLNDVRAQIAELVVLRTDVEALLAHARDGKVTDHDNANICWIFETDTAH